MKEKPRDHGPKARSEAMQPDRGWRICEKLPDLSTLGPGRWLLRITPSRGGGPSRVDCRFTPRWWGEDAPDAWGKSTINSVTKDGTEREDKAREFARFRVCGLDAALAADSDEEQKFAWQQFVSSSKTARETTEADFEKAQARAAGALKALDGAMAATVADAIHEMAVAFRRLFAVQEVMEHRVSSFAKVGLAAKVVGHNWHRKTSDPKVTESRLAEYRELLQRFYADNPRAKWQAAVAHVAGPGADSRKVEAARKFLERQKVRASDFKPLA